MTTTEWIPNGEKHYGMTAVAVSACLSLASMILLFAYCIFLAVRRYRQSEFAKAEEDSRVMRFLWSSNGVLFLNLILGDLSHCIGFMVTFDWLKYGAMPSPPTLACTVQAVTLQMGNIAVAFGATFLASSVFSLVLFSYKFPAKLVASLIAFEWAVVTVMTAVGPLYVARDGGPFYAIAGGWCWISIEYDLMRMLLHHVWVYVAALINLILYSAVAWTILSRRKRAGGERGASARLARSLMLYPIAYILLVTPLASYRAAGHPWPSDTGLAAGAVICLAGFVDCLIFACTRALFSSSGSGKSSVGGATSRRTGNSMSGAWDSRPRFEPKLPTLGAGLGDPDLAFSRTRSRPGIGGASPSARSISFISREEGSDEERASPRMEQVKKEKRGLLATGFLGL
ncbi:hypothetical protein BCR35DRAFT_328780 [Leucosporidium creatinivorum]|uniref:Uncharacterized protein n=1 Tax=Leucosporidium creatinivorum TaxID=106004 RepID=A0A1Y2G0G6_9BASI|nr:hypothetical protein BCR35DRAFT_328780 [Leucosporidium creatinivorum]